MYVDVFNVVHHIFCAKQLQLNTKCFDCFSGCRKSYIFERSVFACTKGCVQVLPLFSHKRSCSSKNPGMFFVRLFLKLSVPVAFTAKLCLDRSHVKYFQNSACCIYSMVIAFEGRVHTLWNFTSSHYSFEKSKIRWLSC